MEFETLDCNRCGGSLTEINSNTYKCTFCGKIFHKKEAVDNTKTFRDMFDEMKREHVNNLRRNLFEAVTATYISSYDVKTRAEELKKFIPEDFLANFFIVASAKNDKAVCRFIKKIDVEANYSDVGYIISFLIKSLQPVFLLDLNNLIERAYKNTDLELFEKYATELSVEAEKVKKGVYETTLPREVFICYSSKDMDKVTDLCEVLEEQGFECFVAARNLRHGKGAVEDYNKALESAMDHCKCIVFVSSMNSRSTGCDAIRIELPYIQDRDISNAPAGMRSNYAQVPHKYKKPRVEYRIEESRGFNVADKIVDEFFEGYERVYSPKEVAVRVLKGLNSVSHIEEDKPKTKYCASCGEETRQDSSACTRCGGTEFVGSIREYIELLNKKQNYSQKTSTEATHSMSGDLFPMFERAKMHLSYGEFADADRVFEDILNRDPNNAEAYVGKLMVDLKVKKESDLKKHPISFAENKYYKYAQRTGNAEVTSRLSGYIAEINTRNETARKDGIYNDACRLMRENNIAGYQNAIAKLQAISPWKDSREKIAQCHNNIQAITNKEAENQKNSIYQRACALMKENEQEKQIEAAELFASIPGWKDANDRQKKCRESARKLKEQRELDRKNAVYDRAVSLMALNEQYTFEDRISYREDAIKLLESIKNYKDSQQKISECKKELVTLRKEKDEADRRELERMAAEEAQRRRKRCRVFTIVSCGIVFCIVFQILLISVIIPSVKFSEAVKLMENGKYATALSKLKDIDGFGKSEQMIAVCEEKLEEKHNNAAYEKALSLMKEKKYLDAIDAFEQILAYRDSQEKIVECKNAINDIAYSEAIVLLNDGRYADAIAAFETIKGYKDSAEKIVECENALKDIDYDEAINLMTEGKYADAIAAFEAMDGYKDSANKALECKDILYDNACALMSEGKYVEAIVIFNNLDEHLDSNAKLEECQSLLTDVSYNEAINYMNNGKYQEAIAKFTDLGDHRDSKDKIAECKHYAKYSFELLESGEGYSVCGFKGTDTEFIIPSYYNGLPILSISKEAFEEHRSLTSVIIPDSVNSIGGRAFYGCTRLKSVVIGNSVTSIDFAAFSHCTSLESVVIGESVTSIGNVAFNECTSLESVVMPDSVTSIGSSAFSDCTSLTSVEIPDSVTSIGDSAFRNCTSLTSVVIGEGVTSIGDNAFWECSGITEIYFNARAMDDFESDHDTFNGVGTKSDGITLTIGATVNKIPANLFRRQYTSINIISVIFAEYGACNIIGHGAFNNCDNLTSIVIPDSVTSIGYSAFSDCTSLTSVEIPDSVTSIDGRVFYNCISLTSVEIPDSVTSIGDSAFSDCTSLTSVVIPDSVTSIGERAFSDCTSLESVVIPDSVTSIGERAFYNCTSLESVVIGDGVTNIGESAFYNCTNLTSMVIGDNVTSIGDYAFYNCTSLTTIEMPAFAIPYIPEEYLISVVITSGESIGDYDFKDCTNLTSVVLPDSVTSIGDCAFQNCTNLTSVVIPESVTSIEDGVFSGCTNLKYNEHDNCLYLGNTNNLYFILVKAKNTSITSCKVNGATKFIYNAAFSKCEALTSVEISDSVTKIGSSAFYNCTSLTSVVIGAGVTSIDYYAFSGCENLASVIFKNPNGWRHSKYSFSSEEIVISSESLMNPTSAAWNLSHVYDDMYLYRK